MAILNRDGGTFRGMDLETFCADAAAAFAQAGSHLECRLVDADTLVRALNQAAKDPAIDVMLAGGGDGTISAAAGACFTSNKILAVLPAGTMNLFARSLGVPLNLTDAVKSLATGEVKSVDIGTANGRPFVHQFSVGMHTRLVRIREGIAYSGRISKMLAGLRAGLETLSRPLKFDVEVLAGGRREIRRATAIAITNDLLSEGHVPYAENLDQGVLGVYVVEPMPAFALARLALSLMFGQWKGHPLVSEREVTEVSLRFRHRKQSAQAAIDGELIPLAARVDLRIHPRGLKVLAPMVLAKVPTLETAGAPAG